MSNAVTNALVASYKAARRAGGVEIVYSRPSTGDSVTLRVIPGSQVFSVERDGEFIDEAKAREYLVLASELILGGSVVTPERHDLITQDGVAYRALAIGGEPHWRYSDPYRVVIRIHTKDV